MLFTSTELKNEQKSVPLESVKNKKKSGIAINKLYVSSVVHLMIQLRFSA